MHNLAGPPVPEAIGHAGIDPVIGGWEEPVERWRVEGEVGGIEEGRREGGRKRIVKQWREREREREEGERESV